MDHAFFIAHIVSATIFIVLGTVILFKDPRPALNRVCVALLFCFFIWSASYAGVHFPGTDRGRAMVFENIAAVGWVGFGFFFLWFSWLYARRSGFRGFTAVAALLALVPCALLYLQWTGSLLIAAHAPMSYGWLGLWSDSPWPWAYYAYYLTVVAAALFIIYDYGRRSDLLVVKRQSRVLLLSALVSLFLGSFTNVIMRRAGNETIPSVADCTTAAWAFGLAWAVLKYRLLGITPVIAADRIIKSMKDLLFLLDTNGRIISLNPAVQDVLGFSDDDLSGKPFETLLAGTAGDREHLAGIIKKVPMQECETELLTRADATVPVSLSTSTIRGIGIVCVAHDRTLEKARTEHLLRARDRLETEVSLTAEELEKANSAVILERKKGEEEAHHLRNELHHARKMEAIGRLAGGIAHDFNNLLSGIVGYADLLRMKCASSLPAEAATAQKIVDITRQASSLTSQLLAFARKGKYQIAPVDLHECINETILILERTIGKNITIVRRFNAGVSTVMGDKSQLQNVLLNLGVNARDAMPRGGSLTFETGTVEIGELLARSYPYTVEPGPFIKLSVTDTGEGMDEETRSKAFEPFFTTKASGKGTGLGLASVYGTVKNHNGFIELWSEKGAGTAIILCLPLAAAAVPEQPEGVSLPGKVAGKHRILFVDDEAFVRDMASEALAMLGYAVTPCAGGNEAIECYQACGGAFDLVILDLTMPGMSGKECFYRLKAINPLVKVMATSGHVLDHEINALLDNGLCAFLQKPFDLRGLSVMVGKVIAGG
ncbi:MAG: response regulator [Chitinispirillaceae bacterium]|nr:response regulator [Chitinispirillaceae bacterium]